jgi:transposase
VIAGWRRVVELAMSGEDIGRLTDISRSRTERASRVERAQMLLAYQENPSFCAVGEKLGVHHQTVQRCVERALAYGALAALDDRPRPGKEPTITPEAKAWLVSLACDKAKEHGYAHELWTTRLLARHAREHGPAAGHECLTVVGREGGAWVRSAKLTAIRTVPDSVVIGASYRYPYLDRRCAPQLFEIIDRYSPQSIALRQRNPVRSCKPAHTASKLLPATNGRPHR